MPLSKNCAGVWGVDCSLMVISRALRKLGLTRKKGAVPGH